MLNDGSDITSSLALLQDYKRVFNSRPTDAKDTVLSSFASLWNAAEAGLEDQIKNAPGGSQISLPIKAWLHMTDSLLIEGAKKIGNHIGEGNHHVLINEKMDSTECMDDCKKLAMQDAPIYLREIKQCIQAWKKFGTDLMFDEVLEIPTKDEAEKNIKSNCFVKNESHIQSKSEEKMEFVNDFQKFAENPPNKSREQYNKEVNPKFSKFTSAREQRNINMQMKSNRGQTKEDNNYSCSKKSKGPVFNSKAADDESLRKDVGCYDLNGSRSLKHGKNDEANDKAVDERLRNIDPKMIEIIMSEIIDHSSPITWDDIAGLDHAKKTINEIVIWPMLRPDLFTGLRCPPKGLLLFGPPGTGKTMIGKCIASQSKATFFSISASSLTSKWVGDGEKMVRALFAVARCNQPAVVFIDEIDSILTQRSDGECDASRRIKTEFLIQFDGAATSAEDRVLIVGATNRPHELDEAARRRLQKRLYIPLPDHAARRCLLNRLLSSQKYILTPENIEELVSRLDGYSGSDIHGVCREASMNPLRIYMQQHSHEQLLSMTLEDLPEITLADFNYALTQIRSSVSPNDLQSYQDWHSRFGSLS